jgi:hypothetical protein
MILMKKSKSKPAPKAKKAEAPKVQLPATTPQVGVMRVEDMPSESAKMLLMIEGMTRQKGVDVDKIRGLTELFLQLRADEARRAYNAAMIACQLELRPIQKDLDNKQTASKYASLAQLDAAIRPIYQKHGFALTFGNCPDDTNVPDMHVRVFCDVLHVGGHQERIKKDIPADGLGPKGKPVQTKTHAAGSADSYGRRYLQLDIFNLITKDHVDDDGNAAGGRVVGGRVETETGEVITTEQIAQLESLLTKNELPLANFLNWEGSPSLADIFASRYDRCVDAIETFGARQRETKLRDGAEQASKDFAREEGYT